MKFSRLLFFGILLPAVAFFSVTSKALAAPILVANEAELQAADSSMDPGDVVMLTSDFEVSERVEFYSSDFTLDGAGHTISPNFTWTSNTNNSALVFFGEDVAIQDLTVDGSLGTELHGLQAYTADNIMMNNVTSINNGRSGIVVNGSTVTVTDVYTDGNGWHGINVDQGDGVTNDAILTVKGTSFHGDSAPIYVDHYLAGVRDVIDFEGQYIFFDGIANSDGSTDGRVYILDAGAPDVTITAPSDGDTVSGMVDLRVTIVEDYLAQYEFSIKDADDNVIYDSGIVPEYSSLDDELFYTWDTTAVDDGEYVIMLIAKDIYGQSDEGSTDSIAVMVDNSTDEDPGDDDTPDEETNAPEDADECKKGGWGLFSIFFKNQGDCVSYVKANENAKGNRRGNL